MATRPYLSVVIPAKNAAPVLPRTLQAVADSELPRESWELIVVDDVSTDDTALVASAYADLVIRLTGRSHGPAYARNRGVERARGHCIVFFDADVVPHADTLSRIALLFASNPDIAAAFGTYDSAPAAPGLVSQYRNLLHHFTHVNNAGEAHTFWAGCGAVRRHVFIEAGMYDEWRFPRPQIEDIELGHRICGLGYRIVLRPDIQGTHLKRWTLREMIATDFKDRGVPWARLLAEGSLLLSVSKQRATVLNLRAREKVNTALIWVALAYAGLAPWTDQRDWLWVSSVCVLYVLVSNRALYRRFEKHRGFKFALGVIPLHLLYYVINGLSVMWGLLLVTVVGEPRPDPTIEALSEIGAETWPPVPLNRKRPTRPVVLPVE